MRVPVLMPIILDGGGINDLSHVTAGRTFKGHSTNNYPLLEARQSQRIVSLFSPPVEASRRWKIRQRFQWLLKSAHILTTA